MTCKGCQKDLPDPMLRRCGTCRTYWCSGCAKASFKPGGGKPNAEGIVDIGSLMTTSCPDCGTGLRNL